MHHMPASETARDRSRLAAGEPGARLVADYDGSASSLQRHRTNCLGLPSSNRIKKEAARGTAAAALLPSKEILSGSYFELCSRIDQIIEQARNEGSLKIALAGLNSVRQTFDSLARLGGHTSKSADSGRDGASADAAVEVARISQCLLDAFDHEPEIKARIAAALLTLDQDDTTHPVPSGSEPLGHGAAMSDNGALLISQSNSVEQPRPQRQ
jgi:hypothetical protein